MKIIGITGTLGAGKGTIVDYLVNELGFAHFSVRQYLNDELKRLNIPQDRDSQRELANKLRTEHGSSYIVMELFKKVVEGGKDSVIESIRNPGEVEFLKKQGGILFAVDADRKIRYERVIKRASETDQISFDVFKNQEEIESKNTNPNVQNLSKCILMADIKFDNNGTIKDLYEQIKQNIKKYE